MTGLARRLLAATVAVFTLVAGSSAAMSQPLPEDPTDPAAQPNDPPTRPGIEWRSISPWVEADDTFRAVFRVDGFGPDATLSWQVHQALSGSERERRERLAAMRNGDDSGAILHGRRSVPLEAISDGGLVTLEIPIRTRSGANRDALYIPNAGTYPVDVRIVDPTGRELTTRVFLNRLPQPQATQAPPIRLAVVVDLPQSLGTVDDGGVDADEASVLASTFDDMAALADRAGDLPLAFVLTPQSVAVLGRHDTDVIEGFHESIGSRPVFATTWAELDLESWAETGTWPSFRQSLDDGLETLRDQRLGTIESRVWPPDPTLGPRSLAWLRRARFELLLLREDQLLAAPGTNTPYTRRVEVGGEGGVTSGFIADPDLDRLTRTDPDDPVLAAHEMLSLLAAERQVDDVARGTVVIVDELTRTEVVEALFDALAEGLDALDGEQPSSPAVLPVTPAGLLDVPTALDDAALPVRVGLVPRSRVDDVATVDELFALARPLVDDFAALVGATDDESLRLATVIERSLDRRIDPELQAEHLRGAIARFEEAFAQITLPKPRALNVTERQTTIPFRITNGLDRPVNVTLQLKSSRLRFLDGEVQTLRLEPGLNRIDLRVEAQASGQFAMQAEVRVAGSPRVLASTRQTIRSTAFSGVGLILSGGALVFLVVWWLRTPRRRNDHDGDGEAENGAGATVPPSA